MTYYVVRYFIDNLGKAEVFKSAELAKKFIAVLVDREEEFTVTVEKEVKEKNNA